MLKTLIISTMLTLGCISPTTPTDCLGPGLERTYERLEGARPGDPDYALAKTWSAICPEWGLLSE
jgi:hypothetical protein